MGLVGKGRERRVLWLLFGNNTTARLAELSVAAAGLEVGQLFEELDMVFALKKGPTRLVPFELLAGGNLVREVVVEVAEFLGPVGGAGVELSFLPLDEVLEQQRRAMRTAGIVYTKLTTVRRIRIRPDPNCVAGSKLKTQIRIRTLVITKKSCPQKVE